jgi:hypothetical protein
MEKRSIIITNLDAKQWRSQKEFKIQKNIQSNSDMARYGYPYEKVYQILLIYLIGDLNNWFFNATNMRLIL